MISSDYLSVISEYYDLSDSYTLDQVVLCTEAKKESVAANLAHKLYEKIRDKVDEIDFGTIPKSKGDITKIDGYANLVECIDIIHKLIKEYGQSTESVDHISTAIENIQKRKRIWEKSFALNIETPKITYNTMTLSVVSSVTLLINTCIEYIKNPDNTITTALDKASYIKQREHVLFVSLRDFNASCDKGVVDKVCETAISMNAKSMREAYAIEDTRSVNEGIEGVMDVISDVSRNPAVRALAVALFVLKLKDLIIFLGSCINYGLTYLLKMKQSVSDHFAEQADFLQINAENLKYRENIDDAKKKKIYEKQMAWVNRFRKWSNAFMIKDKKAQNDTKREQENDKNQKYPKDEEEDDDDGGIF